MTNKGNSAGKEKKQPVKAFIIQPELHYYLALLSIPNGKYASTMNSCIYHKCILNVVTST